MFDKKELDNLYIKYASLSFINTDPVQFIHRYSSKRDIEIVGLISALFSFGSRKQFIPFIDKVLSLLSPSPYDTLYNNASLSLAPLSYRFVTEADVSLLFSRLHLILKEYGTLYSLFLDGLEKASSIKGAIEHFAFHFNESIKVSERSAVNIPLPSMGSACKRFNMYLRWLVRKDKVDLGIWDLVPLSDLYIPLDTHSLNVSRLMGFTKRKSASWSMLEEIMGHLRGFDPVDPTKYDFSLFGYGIENKI